MNAFLDTSCLVSFFISDVHHQKAKSVIERVLEGEAQGMMSALSLAELCGAIRRNKGEAITRQVKNAMAGLTEKGLMSIIPITNSDAYAASDLAISTGLRGADAVIVNAAKQSKSKLITSDEEIKKKAGHVVEFYEA